VSISYNSWITPAYIYSEAGGVFSANFSGQVVFDYFPDGAQAGDALYFGHNPRFDDVQVYIGTPFAADSAAFVWEYWNGSAWAPLAVTDGTNGWTATGQQVVGFTPPDDWRECEVNGVKQMWVRCRLEAVSNPTEGGANATEAVQVGDNLLVVTGYTETAPCNFETLYEASLAGNWDVVLRQGLDQYFLRARVQVGDGSTPTWLIDEDKQVEFAYLGVPWTSIIALLTKSQATARFGRILDAELKIGGHGCCFNWGELSNISMRNIGGSLEFYGCSFSSRGWDAKIAHCSGVKIWNCLFHGQKVGTFNLSGSELYHLTLLEGATLDETQPDTAMDDLRSYLNGGYAFLSYAGERPGGQPGGQCSGGDSGYFRQSGVWLSF